MRGRQFQGRWFRVYDEAADDPKIQMLSDKLHRFLFNCWCLASKHGGYLPPISEIAWRLRKTEAVVASMIAELNERGLLDEEGDTFEPHNWQARQFQSDVSTQRVKAFRERKRNDHETPETEVKRDETVSETAPEQNRTETEQNRPEQRRVSVMPRAADLSGANSQRFEEWWTLWSSSRGSNHRTQAAGAWMSVALMSNEQQLFECTRSYVESRSPGDGGYNPENFLFDQARDGFAARWPPKARDSPRPTRTEITRAQVIAGMDILDQIRRT
jgi:hypothetical protein